MRRISEFHEHDVQVHIPEEDSIHMPNIDKLIPLTLMSDEPKDKEDDEDEHHHVEQSHHEEIVRELKKALAEEFLAWYQYIICHEFLYGNERTNIEEFYKESAKDEFEDHACWLMKRINELGGDLAQFYAGPQVLSEIATHDYIVPVNDVAGSIQKNILAERGAIETYKNIEKLTRDNDPVTNSKIKEILADEEEHLQKLKDFQDDITKNTIAKNPEV